MKTVYVVHTSLVLYADLMDLFAELMPDVRVFNIIDDSLLSDVTRNGDIDAKIVGRMCKYFEAAAANGADLILTQCSSVGEATDVAARLVAIPVVKIDEAMAEKAVELGRRIAVVGTAKSTMKPSCELVRSKAAAAGRDVEVVGYLVDGALEVLMKEKNREKHNALVLATVRRAEAECDVIVLAQGSMTVLLPELREIRKPVLTSLRMGIEKTRAVLFGE